MQYSAQMTGFSYLKDLADRGVYTTASVGWYCSFGATLRVLVHNRAAKVMEATRALEGATKV